jgi:hypothetical protein
VAEVRVLSVLSYLHGDHRDMGVESVVFRSFIGSPLIVGKLDHLLGTLFAQHVDVAG